MEKDSDKLTLFILEQNAKGPASKFKPWLDVMPREFGSPFFATERELELLKGDPMYVCCRPVVSGMCPTVTSTLTLRLSCPNCHELKGMLKSLRN